MLEFKNREVNAGIKRKLKVLNVERDDNGEIKRLFVQDNILKEECLEEGTKIKAQNLNKIIQNMIEKEIMTAQAFTERLVETLIAEIKNSYSDNFVLPNVDIAICNWMLCDDYLDLIKIDKYNANINREIADAHVEMKLEVVYKGCYASKTCSTIIKGRGVSEFDDPNEAIRELVRRVPSYLTENYVLPTIPEITWSLVDPNENDVVLQDNKLIILNNSGDDVAELIVTCRLRDKEAQALMRFVIGKKYKLSTNYLEINQRIGSPKSSGVEIYSPVGKNLYAEVSVIDGSFNTSVVGNNTSSLCVKITETENLNNSYSETNLDNFYLTVKIYDNQDKTILYGEEVVNIRYNYQRYTTDITEAYWSERNKYSGFKIRSIGDTPLYAKVVDKDSSVNIVIYDNGETIVSLVASYNYESNNNEAPTTTVTYSFTVALYSDSKYSQIIGEVDYQLHYTLTPTDPFD